MTAWKGTKTRINETHPDWYLQNDVSNFSRSPLYSGNGVRDIISRWTIWKEKRKRKQSSFSNSSNIKSPWRKMLSFLCLYKIKTRQITVFNILYGEMKSKASFHHSRFVYYGEMKSKASFHHSRIYYGEMMPLISFHHSRLLHTAIWRVFFFLLPSITDYCRLTL